MPILIGRRASWRFQTGFVEISKINPMPAQSGAFKLRRVERLKRVDITDRLRLLVPLEVAQPNVFRREVRQEEAIFFDWYDCLLHIHVMWWIWVFTTKLSVTADI